MSRADNVDSKGGATFDSLSDAFKSMNENAAADKLEQESKLISLIVLVLTHLPVAVMVRFDHYTGPTMHDGTVPITPVRRNWSSSGGQCSRLQLPLKLAWAVTIHKSQGLTLDKDVGKKKFSCGLTFVACSRVRKLKDILFMPPFSLQRLKSIANSKRLQERKEEDQRLLSLQEPTAEPFIEDIPVSISEDQETTLMEWMTPSLLTSAPHVADTLSTNTISTIITSSIGRSKY